MKKSIKRALLIITVIVVLFIGTGLYYYIPMLTMASVKAGKIQNTNVTVVNAMSAVYFIKTESGYIMIDAGLSAKSLAQSMKEASINPGEVKWIFLTHSDGDHVGGLTLFPYAEIHISEDEFPLLNGEKKRSVFGGNKMPSGIDINNFILLHGGQELLLDGIKINCIKAPGHTPGSMVFLADGKYLFTGDVLKIKDGAESVHPYSMDKALSKKTIQQLKEIINGSSIIFTSHYGVNPYR